MHNLKQNERLSIKRILSKRTEAVWSTSVIVLITSGSSEEQRPICGLNRYENAPMPQCKIRL